MRGRMTKLIDYGGSEASVAREEGKSESETHHTLPSKRPEA